MRNHLLLLVLAFCSGSVWAQLPGKSFRLTPEMIRFTYESYGDARGVDGRRILRGQGVKCKHEIEAELSQDWKVECVTAEGAPRRYRVHLWLTGYSHRAEPLSTYELLYWVTDRSKPEKIQGTGGSLWFNFRNVADLHSITAGQTVENDTAGLYLDVKIP